jgi:cytochrome c553
MVRQIWDIQQGVRNGEPAQLMKLAVANLTPDDLIAIAAYVASRAPSSGHTSEKAIAAVK